MSSPGQVRAVACPHCKAVRHQFCVNADGTRAHSVIHEARKLAYQRAKKERAAREATFPKCETCGNVLGLQRVRLGLTQCRGCFPDSAMNARQALSALEDRAIAARTVDDLTTVVVDLINELKRRES